ncbi:maleylpyruvate isomerase N-terminal domain-containing protein [Allokutzneria albata]|uniref:TIGR03083 family protein n=1 Tax=Allokutzneria albata TaxID=211114 RepID=A0A1H0CS83_ALLAB|nr:maleylpyruvate isomerase N-terminal domain-containing protein [Allokutzneria albata]SDN60738.1 TIGR03083 family protein [Allokutzneria albata]
MSGAALIDHGRLLDVLVTEGETLANSAPPEAMDLPVPGRPGLTVGAVLRQAADGYRGALAWMRDRGVPAWPVPEQRGPAPDERQDSVDRREELRAGLVDLVVKLGEHEPEEPCPTWWPQDQTYGFWRRRMAHESTVHRIDVQAALGGPVLDVPEDVALDGVDEVLLLWLGHRLRTRGITGPHRCALGIRTSDHAWYVRVEPAGISVFRAVPTGLTNVDAIITGAPSAVYRWLWGRAPDHTVRLVGDRHATAQLWALLRLATA